MVLKGLLAEAQSRGGGSGWFLAKARSRQGQFATLRNIWLSRPFPQQKTQPKLGFALGHGPKFISKTNGDCVRLML
jgi:hypothetical protein